MAVELPLPLALAFEEEAANEEGMRLSREPEAGISISEDESPEPFLPPLLLLLPLVVCLLLILGRGMLVYTRRSLSLTHSLNGVFCIFCMVWYGMI